MPKILYQLVFIAYYVQEVDVAPSPIRVTIPEIFVTISRKYLKWPRLSIFACMQTFDTLTYFSGMSAGIFFFASLICGLQLCFNMFGSGKRDNIILSKPVGAIMLLMSCSTICYIVCDSYFPSPTLLIAGNTIDFTMCCLSALAAHVLYAGNRPTTRAIIIMSAPFIILATINIFVPAVREYLLDAVILTLILQYAYYAIMLRHYEDSLEVLCSNPEVHSFSWIRGAIALFAGWWALRTIFNMPVFSIWYDTALYTYMVFLVCFVFIKINKLGKPVSLETQKTDRAGRK